MTLTEFGKVFGALAIQLRAESDPTAAAAYFDVLSELPLEAVRVAAVAFARESERRWFPTTAEWHQEAANAAREALLRETLTASRVEPWHHECETCEDTGWVLGVTCSGEPAGACGQPRLHAAHDWTRPCVCRPTNKTWQRHQSFGQSERI